MSKIRTLVALLQRPRKAMPQLLELAGFSAVTAGCWQIAEPAGLIVGGLLAALVAYTLEPR